MKEFLTKLFGDVVTDEKMQQFDKEIGIWLSMTLSQLIVALLETLSFKI